MRRPGPAALIAAVVMSVIASLALAGCGSSQPDLSGLSAQQLLSKATRALKKEPYVSIEGQIGTTKTETGLDLHYIGQDASYGRLRLPQGSLRFERIGQKTWLKPDAAFLRAQLGAGAAAVSKLLEGKWILADPANQAFGELIQVASRDFVDSQVLSSSSGVSKGAPATVHGTPCVTLKTKTGRLYLDAATALPVEVSGTGDSGVGKAHFSYADLTAPTAPAPDEQVDLSKLAG